MARSVTPSGLVPSRRQRDVHTGFREGLSRRNRVGRPTRMLFGFTVAFLLSLFVVFVSTLIGQPQPYSPPLLNRTDQLVVAQWDPQNTVQVGGVLNPDPVVSWEVKFTPGEAQPDVALSWGGYDRFGDIYLFMDANLEDALQLPCAGLHKITVTELPGPLFSMVAAIDADDSGTTPLRSIYTSDSGGATCRIRPNYATSSNEPYVNVVTPNTIIARSQLTAPVGGETAKERQIRPNQVQVHADTYPTDFRLDTIQASTNSSAFNNGRLTWNTSDLKVSNAGNVQETYQASFEQIELKFLSTEQQADSSRLTFYAAIFLGLGLGVAAECMFRLLMDEHTRGDFWTYTTKPPRNTAIDVGTVIIDTVKGIGGFFAQLVHRHRGPD